MRFLLCGLFLSQFILGLREIPFPYDVPKRSSQRLSSYPYISGDTFRSFCDHIVDETDHGFNPEAVKDGDIIFLKNDTLHIPFFFLNFHPKIHARYILLIHNGDCGIPSLLTIFDKKHHFDLEKYLDDEKIIVIFSQNVDKYHEKLKPIPIGIPNRYWPTGNISILDECRNNKGLLNKIDNVYFNFSAANNPIRGYLLSLFSNKSFCHFARNQTLRDYLLDMRQYRFVMSPPGNGIDCHRTWEALLMGCIPIVQHSCLDQMFANLPVILVKNWEVITPIFLEEQAQELARREYKWEKMYIDYWIDLIRSYKQPLG